MRMTTCEAGITLMRQGETFYAWDPGTFDEGIKQVDIEVPHGAYKIGQTFDEDGALINEYHVIKLELVKIIPEGY